MNSPLFSALGGGDNNMAAQFKRFMNEMQGKDPREEVNRLLQSGCITQQQLNQIQQTAMQMKDIFNGVMK